MTDTVTFSAQGFSEFEEQLLQLADFGRADLVVRNTLTNSIKKALEPVASTATTLAPYDPKNSRYRHLRDTVKVEARIPNNNDKKSYYVSETDVVIGVVSVAKSAVSLSQEYGNKRVRAKPYLIPALEQNMQTVVSNLASELGEAIPKYAAKLGRAA